MEVGKVVFPFFLGVSVVLRTQHLAELTCQIPDQLNLVSDLIFTNQSIFQCSDVWTLSFLA